jgi:hypothetical protein
VEQGVGQTEKGSAITVRTPRICGRQSVAVRAILLLVEGPGIKGARRSGNAGQDGQSKKRGYEGFHDRSPRLFSSVWRESLLLALGI